MDKTLNKVAEITIFFWVLKILATTIGEMVGDMLSMTLNMGYAVSLGITFCILIAVLTVQILSRKFNPLLYWLAIIGTTTTGTEISDFLDRSLHAGYLIGSLILVSLLGAVLGVWYARFKNLSVYPIYEKQPEIFFWLAVLASNSLGTAFGDYLTDNAGLSYLQGAMVTALVIGVVVILHYKTRLNHVLLFWLAFVFTRPFGATFGDLLTKPLAKGGLDLGTMQASAVTILLFAAILYVAEKRRHSEP